MVDIKWVDGAICYAGRFQFKAWDVSREELITVDNISIFDLEQVLSFKDFQLNEIRIGDYIEASELDTEQKYKDAVGAFGLFGFPRFNSASYTSTFEDKTDSSCLKVSEYGDLIRNFHKGSRQLKYSQLMAIGKLKRAMVESDEVLIDAVENTSILKDTLGSAKDYTPAVTIEGENTKASRAYDILESMNIFYDEVEKVWYKKEYL